MSRPRSLWDLLACPACRVHLDAGGDGLVCPECRTRYPIIDGTPVIFPQGAVPEIRHEARLQLRKSYDPWVHRVVLQSLLDDQIVVDVGAGNMALDDPAIIRMDVTLTPYTDLVADVHAMPFLPGSLDYVFSLAVVEHLYNPFQAARSMREVLKDGGYVYHECNFVFAYHGYPHHYFNASLQGMESVFAGFVHLRKGVAPYQMPSYAVEMLLESYLRHSHASSHAHGRQVTSRMRELLDLGLRDFDFYFTEEGALNVAAGTYLAGMKRSAPEASLIPPPLVALWRREEELQRRFPRPHDLTTVDNILAWAKTEGRTRFAEVDRLLAAVVPFNKAGDGRPWDRSAVREMPWVEPVFHAMGYAPGTPMAVHAEAAERRPPARNRRRWQRLRRWLRR